jgi:hypothetical protein
VYYPVARSEDGQDIPIYLHAKVMLIDDRFLTVGSANCTNRSMAVDTELNVAWEALADGGELGRSIRSARISLLREHCGAPGGRTPEVESVAGLVRRLDALARSGRGALRPHPMSSWVDEGEVAKFFGLDALCFDPETPLFDDEGDAGDPASFERGDWFSRGITVLREWLSGAPSEPEEAPPMSTESAGSALDGRS